MSDKDPLTTQEFNAVQAKWLRKIRTALVEYSVALGVLGGALLWLGSQFFVTLDAADAAASQLKQEFNNSIHDLEVRGIDRQLNDLRLKLEFTDEPNSSEARLLRAQISGLIRERRDLKEVGDE